MARANMRSIENDLRTKAQNMTEHEFKRGLELLANDKRKYVLSITIKRMGVKRGSVALLRELKRLKPQTGSVAPRAQVSEQKVTKSEGVKLTTKKKRSKQKGSLVIRDEFPFLADDNCPNEFKILVADMITTHGKYVKAHEMLFDVAHKGNDVCYQTASDVVDNYIENRMIWAELEHYKKTGKILGEHRIFKKQKPKSDITQVDRIDLSNKLYNLNRQVKYRRKQLDKLTSTEEQKAKKAEIETIMSEIEKIKTLLN